MTLSIARFLAGPMRRNIAHQARFVSATPFNGYMDRALLQLAESQLGLLTREQAVAAGMSERGITHRLERGELRIEFPNVYRVSGAPRSLPQRMVGALLWAGPESVLSHSSAGTIWGFESMPAKPVHVAAPQRLNPPPGVRLHRLTLMPSEVFEDGPVRSTSPLRTLLDLGAVVSAQIVAKAVDLAIQKKLVMGDDLVKEAAIPRPGVRGPKVLRKLVDRGQLTSRSVLERRFYRFLQKAGLPLPVPQFPIALSGFTAHIDFAYPDQKIAIECQGFRFHGGHRGWLHDTSRLNQLMMLGWRVLQVTWADLENDPDEVIRHVQGLLLRGTA